MIIFCLALLIRSPLELDAHQLYVFLGDLEATDCANKILEFVPCRSRTHLVNQVEKALTKALSIRAFFIY